MFRIDLNWKAHNLCLGLIDEAMKVAYPDSGDLYYTGQTATLESLTWHFNTIPEGWNGYDENGDPKTPDASSEAEDIVNYWNSLDDQSSVATSYFAKEDYFAAEKRAREDIITKTWDNLSTEQKKFITNVGLSATEMNNIITNHPES